MRLARILKRFIPELLAAVFVLILVAICGQSACGQVYQIDTRSRSYRGQGTAVCVGMQGTTGLFLTAKHNLRGAEHFAVRGPTGYSEGYRVSLHPTEDVAAFCAQGRFEPMLMTADEIPSGAPVQVCGFGPAAHGTPDRFCFAASVDGDTIDGRSHVIPGDSGGAAYVGLGNQSILVGIVSAYYKPEGAPVSRSRVDGQTRRSLIVPVRKIAEWLPTQYSNCPQCIPLQQPRAMSPPQIRYRESPPVQVDPPPQQTQPPATQPQVIIAPCQDDLRKLVAEYLKANPPAAGPPGPPGESINPAAVVDAVMSQIRMPQDGKDGKDGQPGAPGKDGRPGTPGKDALPDPRIDAIIQNIGVISQRIEQLEAASSASTSPGDLQSITSRLQALESKKDSHRVMLIDGASKTVIDDQTYEATEDDPIFLDIRKFLKKGS